MNDPILTAIAVALSTRAAEGLADAGRETFAALVRLVRRKAQEQPDLHAALAAQRTSPTADDRAIDLRRALANATAQDPDFDQELRRRWDVFHQTTLRTDVVTNTVSGHVHGSVVQARDIAGGVHLAPPPQRPQT
ncbi:hypothetical protein [Micromonospora sp. NPDC050495]|uniref:hypothetical protein n=1 Tax=Micromonospora sp. NPDC050495 TaxID=3154936 RepID=UPI003406F835